MHKILDVIAGSKLYGTSYEGSDSDYKTIVLPTSKDILLGQGVGASQTKGEEDRTFWSFQQWVGLLLKMDSNAYEVLFADVLYADLKYYNLIPKAELILTDQRGSTLGFAQSQMTRYALRGKRLEDFINLVEILSRHKKIENALPEIEEYVPDVKMSLDSMGTRMITLHGKSYPVPGPIGDCIKMYNKYVEGASKRAIEAIGSHDWKGLAHAYRIAAQFIELIKTGMIHYPLTEVDLIRKIRFGELDIDYVIKLTEDKIQELKEHAPSDYLISPREKDQAYNYAQDLIVAAHYRKVKSYV